MRKTSVKELLAQEPFKHLIFDCSVTVDHHHQFDKTNEYAKTTIAVLHPLVTIKVKIAKDREFKLFKISAATKLTEN